MYDENPNLNQSNYNGSFSNPQPQNNPQQDYSNMQNPLGGEYPDSQTFHSIPEAPNPYYQSNPKQDVQPKKPKKSFLHNIGSFFKSLIDLVVLLVLISGGVLIFILIRPNSELARWVDKNTTLNEVLSLDKVNSSNNTTSSSSSSTSSNVTNNTFQFETASDSKTAAEIVKNSLPSVLSISVKSLSTKFTSTELVAGTGIIVSSDGLVVTNKHVIANKCKDTSNTYQITGLSQNQKAYNLDLLSVDPIDDIAILKISGAPAGTSFTPVKFADTNNAVLGTEVLAIGNALGELQNSVTKGIVSGLNRSLDQTGSTASLIDECTGQQVPFLDGLIQTDAAINPGNSGGPLFDNTGLVIGMNSLGSSDAQGIGLAISSNTVVSDLNIFKNQGTIIRPRLGLLSQNISPLQKQQNKWLPVDYGQIILSPKANTKAITKNGPADQAKLQEGDIILEFNGTKIVSDSTNLAPLRRLILSKQPGDNIDLTVLKAKSTTDTGYEYESNPVKIQIKLGSLSFDLPKAK